MKRETAHDEPSVQILTRARALELQIPAHTYAAFVVLHAVSAPVSCLSFDAALRFIAQVAPDAHVNVEVAASEDPTPWQAMLERAHGALH